MPRFGPSYPAFLVGRDGARYELAQERRFCRIFRATDARRMIVISRFVDGSASMSLRELTEAWPTWGRRDRSDFCQNVHGLGKHPEYAGMLELVFALGDSEARASVAIELVEVLPTDEAYALLDAELARAPLETYPNLVQALARTRHPKALSDLEKLLETLRPAATLGTIPLDETRAYATLYTLCALARARRGGSESLEPWVLELARHPSPKVSARTAFALRTCYPRLFDPKPTSPNPNLASTSSTPSRSAKGRSAPN